MTQALRRVTVTLTKEGDLLVGECAGAGKKAKVAPRRFARRQCNAVLAEHFDTMAEGQTIDVEVVIPLQGEWRAELTRTEPQPEEPTIDHLPDVPPVEGEGSVRRTRPGFVNPYTFVPTLPRTGLQGTAFDDAAPASHSKHDDDQWSGTLTLTLTARTPLLLAEPVSPATGTEPAVCDVRLGADGRPLLHGASFKGALRSAYETISASRFGVFFEHNEQLVTRATAESALDLIPARVVGQRDSEKYFQLCRGEPSHRDAGGGGAGQRGRPQQGGGRNGNHTTANAKKVLVPAYGEHKVKLECHGSMRGKNLTEFHEKEVHALVDGFVVTHLALATERLPARHKGVREVSGWLSATGKTFDKKRYERLFVDTPASKRIKITDSNLAYWQAVLRSYEATAEYHDPNDTSILKDSAERLARSWHVGRAKDLRNLPEGTLVYLRSEDGGETATEVHPVMVGRRLFECAPQDLLGESLRPATRRSELSAADRLFGWVPDHRDSAGTNDGASGYRGRLSVRSIECTTADWQPLHGFPPNGIVLAPMSSPKPSQFRFYAAQGRDGLAVERKARKHTGYAAQAGLRGRKMYRWRNEPASHWRPTTEFDQTNSSREYLALSDQNRTQLVQHRRWIRPGVQFTVTLFLNGVARMELAALLWLLSQDRNTPLRLGAGKPYGFGVTEVQLDHDHSELRNAAGVKAGWLSLQRPPRASRAELDALIQEFDQLATSNPVLQEATLSYKAAAAPVEHPVHYPRPTPSRTAESYQWFSNNERTKGRDGEVEEGWALPHVRALEQRLPYIATKTDEGEPVRRGPRPGTRNTPRR